MNYTNNFQQSNKLVVRQVTRNCQAQLQLSAQLKAELALFLNSRATHPPDRTSKAHLIQPPTPTRESLFLSSS